MLEVPALRAGHHLFHRHPWYFQVKLFVKLNLTNWFLINPQEKLMVVFLNKHRDLWTDNIFYHKCPSPQNNQCLLKKFWTKDLHQGELPQKQNVNDRFRQNESQWLLQNNFEEIWTLWYLRINAKEKISILFQTDLKPTWVSWRPMPKWSIFQRLSIGLMKPVNHSSE